MQSKTLGTISLFISMLLVSACSVSSLRCGVEEDRSYVDLVDVPQDIARAGQYYAELCGFAYEADRPVVRIIGQEEE